MIGMVSNNLEKMLLYLVFKKLHAKVNEISVCQNLHWRLLQARILDRSMQIGSVTFSFSDSSQRVTHNIYVL